MSTERDKCEWIDFVLRGPSESGKTMIWSVILKDGGFIGGEVRWYGAWRKYAFFPKENTLYEQQCLRDIANFIETKTREHKSRGEPP